MRLIELFPAIDAQARDLESEDWTIRPWQTIDDVVRANRAGRLQTPAAPADESVPTGGGAAVQPCELNLVLVNAARAPMPYPTFVIAGAPKCGTTSLFTWLVDHPDVCGSMAKEPFFLMDKEHPLRPKHCNFHDHGLEAYPKIFPKYADRREVVVEASTQYIYQSTALEILSSLRTNPRVLFLLRKPSERVFSSFAYAKMKGNVQSELSFAEFVRLIRDHSDPSAVPEWASGPSAYLLPRDIQHSRYIDYLALWRERLGDERMRVVVFETMRANPKLTIQGLCRWLGIAPSFYDGYDFAPRNRTSQVRSQLVLQLARTLGTGVRPGPMREVMKRFYYAVQSKGRSDPRTDADKAALAELDDYFRPYNERLAREFDLNLDQWSRNERRGCRAAI